MIPGIEATPGPHPPLPDFCLVHYSFVLQIELGRRNFNQFGFHKMCPLSESFLANSFPNVFCFIPVIWFPLYTIFLTYCYRSSKNLL